MKDRDLDKFPLSDVELDELKNMLSFSSADLGTIAHKFKLSINQVVLFRKSRSWSRAIRNYNVAQTNQKAQWLTVTEIARLAGVSRVTIHQRIHAGVRGPMLLARKHMLPRRVRGELTERKDKVRLKPRILGPAEPERVIKGEEDTLVWYDEEAEIPDEVFDMVMNRR